MCKCRDARSTGRAFTLVELLVVIGVIAVLIALLMPALSGARDAANRAKCLATLRSMHQAALMHAQEHKGYMPVAGSQSPRHLGVTATPEGLNDRERKKYMYFDDASGHSGRPLPLPAALGHYMGLGPLLRQAESKVTGLGAALASDSVRRLFACAGQDSDQIVPGCALAEGPDQLRPFVYMGYIFNSTALGRQVTPWGETPAGRISAIRRPTEVFLFADGNTIEFPGFGIVASGPDQSMYERLRNSRQLDPTRHRNRMNVMFVDGHAETIMLPNPKVVQTPTSNQGDLDRVGLSKGIFN